MAGGPAPVRSDGIDALMTFALCGLRLTRLWRAHAVRARLLRAGVKQMRPPGRGSRLMVMMCLQQAEVPVTDGDRSVAGGLHG